MIQLVKVTLTSLGTAARVLLAQIRGAGVTGDDDNAESMDGVEVNNPIGFDSRPVLTDTTELLSFRMGAQVIGLYIIDKGRSAKLGDSPSLEEGETRVSGASETGAMLRVRASGALSINCKVGQTLTLTADTATIVIDSTGKVVVTPKAGQFVFIGGESGAQAMLMGDSVTQRLNDLKDAVNACRSDISSIVGATLIVSGATASFGPPQNPGLPTGSVVSAAPAQSTKAKNA